MQIPFIDLKTQYKLIQDRIRERFEDICTDARFILGAEVKELEQVLARYCNVQYGLGCASGTDALLLALMAYDCGPGDIVFTTPFTFFATAEVIALTGAVPVFVDIDPVTFNISPVKLKEAITNFKTKDKHFPWPKVKDFFSLQPKAIISVDLFGLPCAYDELEKIAREEQLVLIEDAAQSFGAEYQGKKACSFGDIACTSFFPAKPLGCYGDGGMCFTNIEQIYEKLVSLRVHGQGKNKYENVRLGLNARLDTLQAAVLLEKIKIFPQELKQRQVVAQNYQTLFQDTDLICPQTPQGSLSAFAQYSILAKDHELRTKIITHCQNHFIPTAIYYPLPLHLQKAFAYLGYKQGDFPVAEDIASRIFSLPMHPYLELEVQEYIAKVVKQVL